MNIFLFFTTGGSCTSSVVSCFLFRLVLLKLWLIHFFFLNVNIESNFFLVIFVCINAEEMDWDRNGTVTFKEFLFAFTSWVGIDDNEEEEEEEAGDK